MSFQLKGTAFSQKTAAAPRSQLRTEAFRNICACYQNAKCGRVDRVSLDVTVGPCIPKCNSSSKQWFEESYFETGSMESSGASGIVCLLGQESISP